MLAPIDDDLMPVAASDATAFSRYLAFSGRPRTAIDKRPIRIVAAFATPTGLSDSTVAPIDAAEEWHILDSTIHRPGTLLERLEGPCTLSALGHACDKVHTFCTLSPMACMMATTAGYSSKRTIGGR
ncbi:MAG: hypothetical protein IPK16_17315 [Anaerolineales bacterium]|nr:hypothetical protein [Anaerolineales bacterium]